MPRMMHTMQEIRILFLWFLVRICLATKTSESSLFVGSIKHGIYFANAKKEEGKRGEKTQLGKF